MSALIDFISGDVDRVVIDRTGFTARFNLLLDFAPPSRPESRLPASPVPRSLPPWRNSLDCSWCLRRGLWTCS